MPTLSLTVNGVPHTLDVPANRFLAEVLRYDLGLTGTKIGCNEAECGACTVIVNGRSVDSCIYPCLQGAGRRRCSPSKVWPASGSAAQAARSSACDAAPYRARPSGWKTRLTAAPAAAGVCAARRHPVRLLHARLYHAGQDAARRQPRSRPTTRSSTASRTPTAAARAMPRSCRPSRPRPRRCARATCRCPTCPPRPSRSTPSASRCRGPMPSPR